MTVLQLHNVFKVFFPKLCLLSRFPRLKTLLTIYDTVLYFQQTDGKLRLGKGIVWPQATVDTHTQLPCVWNCTDLVRLKNAKA